MLLRLPVTEVATDDYRHEAASPVTGVECTCYPCSRV